MIRASGLPKAPCYFLEEARSMNASGGFFIALLMEEATRFINHTDPTCVGANVNQAVISRTLVAAIFFRPPDGPSCFCGGLTLSPLRRSQFRASAIAQKKRPQRGGAGAVTVGVMPRGSACKLSTRRREKRSRHVMVNPSPPQLRGGLVRQNALD
jgi:hypothetical protein